MKHFEYGEQDFVPCECCGRESNDCHHIIFRSQGGEDKIENLIGLCRKHHDLAHNHKIPASELQYIHNNFMLGNRNVFIK